MSITLKSAGGGAWQPKGAPAGYSLKEVSIDFGELRNQDGTYHCVGPVLATITVTDSAGTKREIERVRVEF